MDKPLKIKKRNTKKMHSLKESYKRQMNKKKKPNHTNDIKVE